MARMFTLGVIAAMVITSLAALGDPFPSAYTIDESCSQKTQDITNGLKAAIRLVTQARDLLTARNDPFAGGADGFPGGVAPVFWAPLRNVLWGSGAQTNTQDIVGIYQDIIDGSINVFITCDDLGTNCATDKRNKINTFAWGKRLTDPNDLLFQSELDDGFHEGYNIVICPGAFEDHVALDTLSPSAGDSLSRFEKTWATLLVHELTHVYGSIDFKDYGYGIKAANRLRSDEAAGKAAANKFPSDDAAPTAKLNADSYMYFALAVSAGETTTPMRCFDWSRGPGNAVTINPFIRPTGPNKRRSQI
ncbi:hypothetical protein NA57DRAFT_58984 [Rhizodiscina lignyota]|uniref:Lysine-specific metallo-endopeptidase domain-containing protein n=1 Tax=Rhizodiscina lignyota TaxID=1504668 RepID=A0A9P4IAM9_9PEZI|nr:hypothetical protein NA57DRAFT_58984 [Rhizodiscina lignyota]